MRIQLTEVCRIGKVFRAPADGPVTVSVDVGRRLVAEGRARSLDAPPADKMMRPAATKAPEPSAARHSAVAVHRSPSESIRDEIYVVIPTRGRVEDLDRTLAAVFLEPPADLAEVIVVNDSANETDGLGVAQVVEAYARKHLPVRLIQAGDTLTGHAGVTRARMLGNAEVPGTAVVVELDDHDTPEPGALRILAETFAEPAVLAVYGDYYQMDSKRRLVRRVCRGDYTAGKFLEDGHQASGMRAYRKALYDAVGGRDESETYASEYALFLKFEQYLGAAAATAIRHVGAALCRCPVIGSGISVRHAPEQAKACDRYAYLARVGALLPGSEPVLARTGCDVDLSLNGEPVDRYPAERFDVSIVIPCYRSAQYVKPLADSLAADGYTGKRELVWVIDGDPADYPSLPGKLIRRQENAGFAAACNTGAAYASGDALVFLNADTTVKRGWLRPVDAVGHVGAAAPKIVWPDGSVNSLGSRFDWQSGAFRHITEGIETSRLVDMATGACLAMRRALFNNLGGFDEAYRVGYWEDTDLCMRVRRAGYAVCLAPTSEIVHVGAHSGVGVGHAHYKDNRRRFHERWVESGLVDRFARERGEPVHDGRVVVCMIASNEAEFLAASIESVYPLADRIILVEGGNQYAADMGAVDPQGFSLDGMTWWRAADPRDIIEYVKTPAGRPWRDKCEARQAYLDRLEDGHWVVVLDADEVFTEAGLWRLSALMRQHDGGVISCAMPTFWRDFDTVGRGHWESFPFAHRVFRYREGMKYEGVSQVIIDADGRPVSKWPGQHFERAPLVYHYSWVKPLHKIAAKLDYYRRQCPGSVKFDDYLERVFLAPLDEANKWGTHPMGAGTCEPYEGPHPESIERRRKSGLFGWLDRVKGAMREDSPQVNTDEDG